MIVKTDPLKQPILSNLRILATKEVEASIVFFPTPSGRKLEEAPEELTTNASSSASTDLEKMLEKFKTQLPAKSQ